MSDARFDRFVPSITCLVPSCSILSDNDTVLGNYFGRINCEPTLICIQDVDLSITDSTIGGDIALSSSCGGLVDDPVVDVPPEGTRAYPPTRLMALSTTIKDEVYGNGVFTIGGTMTLEFDSKFMSGTAPSEGNDVYIQLELPVEIRLDSYILRTRETDTTPPSSTTWYHEPKSWTLSGSVDGIENSWVQLNRGDERTDHYLLRKSTLKTVSNPYRFYRLRILDTQDGDLLNAHIGEITLFGNENGNGISTGVVIASVLGSLILAGALAFGIYRWRKTRRSDNV